MVLGGGTPKNFINQASVQAEFYDDRVGGHRYAVQIVTDVPYYGGASGSSLEEAKSWGKLASDAEQVTVHADVDDCPPAPRVGAGSKRARARRSPPGNRCASIFPVPIMAVERAAVSSGAFRGTEMSVPFDYDPRRARWRSAEPSLDVCDFEDPKVVILPVPVDRTTSYVGGTRNGPREILLASSHMELWDDEVGADVHGVGIYTLPEMELPFGELAPLMDGDPARRRARSSRATSFS